MECRFYFVYNNPALMWKAADIGHPNKLSALVKTAFEGV